MSEPTFGGRRHRDYVPGQIVVRVHEGAVRPHFAADQPMAASSARQLPDSVVEPLDYLRREVGAEAVRPLFAPKRMRTRAATASTAGGRRLPRGERQQLAVIASVAGSPSEELAGLTLVEVRKKEVSNEVLRTVERSPAVQFAERIPARWLSRAQPSDANQNRQWGLRAINWYEAQRPDARNVVVAILDTGIDENHPELRGLSIDHHHEGLSKRDIVGHGTHVAGIVSATTNNAVGLNGVTRCKLLVHKVFPDEPADDGEFYVDSARFLRALEAVNDAQADVLNLSLGGEVSSQAEQILFNRLERTGVTVVAAMGNEYEDGNPTEYPAAYDSVFAVGATDETDLRAPFSNTGRHIQLVAPGSNILSTVPTVRSSERDETRYAVWNGTSMATPHVAAAAALLAAKNPAWGPDDIKDRLIKTASAVADMKGSSWTQAYGSGLLDVQRALS